MTTFSALKTDLRRQRITKWELTIPSGLFIYEELKKEIPHVLANMMARKMVFSLLESGIISFQEKDECLEQSETGLILTLKPPVNQSANEKER